MKLVRVGNSFKIDVDLLVRVEEEMVHVATTIFKTKDIYILFIWFRLSCSCNIRVFPQQQKAHAICVYMQNFCNYL